MRIALLEDDPDQSALLQRWLAEDGHDVHAYLSGREAMKQAGRESFDLVATAVGVVGLERMILGVDCQPIDLGRPRNATRQCP